MNKVIAIIGSGYGDEGKGLLVDFYASQYDDAVVIRSNGGAQAGHTVITPDGKGHVFSHFGAGTFSNTPTFLSEFFVLNPLLFRKEHKAFVKQFGFKPEIYADGECMITTPYDMLINQAVENKRETKRHGSVGLGFNETIERDLRGHGFCLENLFPSYDTKIDEVFASHQTKSVLSDLIKYYVPDVILNKKYSQGFIDTILSEELAEDFVNAVLYMLENIKPAAIEDFEDNTLIFEGAQGLLLDMDYGYFPHVTRSNCGMKNINNILVQMEPDFDITVNYVTRFYTTRHGAGPLDEETSHEIYEDQTNVENDFQGKLRFATLDLDLFNSITEKDFLNYAPRGSKKLTTVTHLDQLTDTCRITADNEMTEYDKKDFENKFDFASYGETRDDVKELNNE